MRHSRAEMSTEASTTRFVVTGGGEPDPQQLAALLVALTLATATAPGPAAPAWRRAALLEGVGGAGVLAPSDLDVNGP